MTNSEGVKLDANQLLQEWRAAGLDAGDMAGRMWGMLRLSKTLIETLAAEAGKARETERKDAVAKVVTLARAMDEESREFYARRIAKAMKMPLSEWRSLVKPPKNAREADREEEAIRTAGGWINHHLVELFYDPEKMRTLLAMRTPDGKVTDLTDRLVIEGRVYKPIFPTSSIAKKIVLLPSDMGERMEESELLAMTAGHINKYFDFGSDKFFEEIAPLYVNFTYVQDAFTEVSYLRFLGDYGTGKTRAIKTIGKLCYRPIYISGGSSAASIYRLLDEYRGTLVLNEGDFGASDEASIIAKILNGGTEKDEAVTKMRKDSSGGMDVEAFVVFGCKVICTRREFDDRAIRSRCLTMDMVPFMPHPRIPLSSPPKKELEEMEIRNLWTTYRLHHAPESVVVDESKADRSIEARLNQVTMSLLATVSDNKVQERIKAFLQEYNMKTKEERYNSTTARVVEGLVMANAWGPVSDHHADENRVYLKDVVKAANMRMDEMKRMMDEEDVEETTTTKDGKRIKKQTKMTSRGVSGILDKYCQMMTRRTSDGKDGYRGTTEVVWDDERIKALCNRFGVTWLERGSKADERPADEVSVTFDFKNQPDSSFRKARKEWYGHEDGSLGLQQEGS